MRGAERGRAMAAAAGGWTADLVDAARDPPGTAAFDLVGECVGEGLAAVRVIDRVAVDVKQRVELGE